MSSKATFTNGTLGDYYYKVKNSLINAVDPKIHASTYGGEHDSFYAEPEFTGKYIDLCSKIYTVHGDEKALENAEIVIESIIRNIREDGYLGELKKGEEFSYFSVWNQMFTVMGLISYYNITNDKTVLNICEKCTSYIMDAFINEEYDILDCLNDGTQHSSILLVLTDLYQITKNSKYMDYANYVVNRLKNSDLNFFEFNSIFDLRSQKGIEIFVILIAILKYANIVKDEKAIESVKQYWQEVADTQIRSTGNGTIKELWTKDAKKPAYLDMNEKPNETCVAVGWIELSIFLYKLTSDKKYLDAIDKTLYNHILASISENGDDFAYYQPNYGKKVKTTDAHMYKCCRYRGFTLFTYMADMLFHEDDKCIIPLIYTNSEYNSEDIKIIEKTTYPFDDKFSFVIDTKTEKLLKLRVPEGYTMNNLTINGKETVSEEKCGYVELPLCQASHYEIMFSLKADLKAEYGEINNKKVVSYSVGNVLLALHDENNNIELTPSATLVPISTDNAFMAYEVAGTKAILTDYASADDYKVWIPVVE